MMKRFQGRGFPEFFGSKKWQEVKRAAFIGLMGKEKNKETVRTEVSACRLQ